MLTKTTKGFEGSINSMQATAGVACGFSLVHQARRA